VSGRESTTTEDKSSKRKHFRAQTKRSVQIPLGFIHATTGAYCVSLIHHLVIPSHTLHHLLVYKHHHKAP
jgi:hypothetical protein